MGATEYVPRYPGWTEKRESGGRRCQARRRRSDKQCGGPASAGWNVCRIHGAGGGRPPTHGRYSKIGGRVAAAYEAALRDVTLLDLTEPIALMEAVGQHFAERVAERDTPEFRRTALQHFNAALDCQRKQDPAGMATALGALGELLRRGADEDSALIGLSDQAERLAKRIEGAWGVRLARQQAINAKDLVAVLSRFIDIVRIEASPEVAEAIVRRVDYEMITDKAVS